MGKGKRALLEIGATFVAFVVVMVVWHMFERPTVDGRVYVMTNGREVVNMPGIDVWVLEETTLKKVVRESCKSLNAEFANFEAKMKELEQTTSLNPSQAEIQRAETLLSEWDSYATKKMFLDVEAESLKEQWDAKAAGKPLSSFVGAFQHTTTDTEGHFHFTLPKRGKFVFVATGDRQVLRSLEKYFWIGGKTFGA
ncbi:MAG: hypothetical protein JWR69_3992, partial [Pedosphaera sp.]|nr:hypothetical protein [Pedosphaera sp.]